MSNYSIKSMQKKDRKKKRRSGHSITLTGKKKPYKKTNQLFRVTSIYFNFLSHTFLPRIKYDRSALCSNGIQNESYTRKEVKVSC
jgi:hypothetical protein